MLQDKIKSLINIIQNTEINELEVSSFWGAQKIRLQKNLNGEIQNTEQPTTISERQTIPVDGDSETEPVASVKESKVTLEPEVETNPSNTVAISVDSDRFVCPEI